MNFIEENNRIYVKNEKDEIIAEVTFKEIENGVYDIDHTFVDESLRGKGVASELVKRAVEKIEKSGAKVTASCSYAKHWLEKNRK